MFTLCHSAILLGIHTKLYMFRYDGYLAMYTSNDVVEIDAWLGEHCDYFHLRGVVLGCPPPKRST